MLLFHNKKTNNRETFTLSVHKFYLVTPRVKQHITFRVMCSRHKTHKYINFMGVLNQKTHRKQFLSVPFSTTAFNINLGYAKQ